MPAADIIIAQTRNWIRDVVIGCNFCPFAARELKRDSIHYELIESTDKRAILEALALLFEKMKVNPGIETALLILPTGFGAFTIYLKMLELAEALLEDEGYEGIFQLASFHPAYLFAGAKNDDPSNYTNRSPYPMLQILREASVSTAVDSYPNVDDIPQKNISFTIEKGLAAMQLLRDNAMKESL